MGSELGDYFGQFFVTSLEKNIEKNMMLYKFEMRRLVWWTKGYVKCSFSSLLCL